jgi:hypothetical protein
MVGGVLFVNGLVFLGQADARSAAVFNIFVGLLQTAVPFFLLTQAATPDEILAAAPIFLFGLTYLWTGVSSFAKLDGSGLGWYCLWVVGMTVAFAAVSFFRFDDFKQGVIWLNWGALWGIFWLILALGQERLTRGAGWVTLIMSIWTCTIPALLHMVDGYADVPDWTVLAATAVTAAAALLAPGGWLTIRDAPLQQRPARA